MEDKFWVAVLVQAPLIAVFLYALRKRWLVDGGSHDREIAEKDARIAFQEVVRQEGLDRERKLVSSLEEMADVMERSTELNERLVDDALSTAPRRRGCRPRPPSSREQS